MAKISISRIFDIARIASTSSYKDLETFIQYLNTFVDNIIRILLNGASIKDNFDATVLNITVKHNVPQTVSVPKKAFACFVGLQNPSTPVVTCAFTATSDNLLYILPAFSDALSTASIEVRIVVFHS